MKTFIITSAGGNPTVIQILEGGLRRDEYKNRGAELMAGNKDFVVEQAGFLVYGNNQEHHFEMSGGEFCGNATRAGALLIQQQLGTDTISLTTSGFENNVVSTIRKIDANKFYVSALFTNFTISITDTIFDQAKVHVVDMGGIVHIVIEGEFPENYVEVHSLIVETLHLEKRDAVGVVWTQRLGDKVVINPVVWVRETNTFFHETSCGSGSIAVALVTNIYEVQQPSGGIIGVAIDGTTITLESEMEIVHESI